MNRIFRITITGIFLTALGPFTAVWKVFSQKQCESGENTQ